jgi:hypothetical protein
MGPARPLDRHAASVLCTSREDEAACFGGTRRGLRPPGGARAPLRDSAFGYGRVLQTNFFGGAEAGPNGEDPVGSLTLSGFLNFTTATTCLNISGNAVVGGGRILAGRRAGKGFLSSSVDHGPPINGKRVDVTVYSGRRRLLPPPGTRPAPGASATGIPPNANALRILVRVCGAPGIALLRLTQRTSPTGRNARIWLRGSWRDELRQDRRCQRHWITSPLASSAAGRHRVTVRARTTGRRWSRTVAAKVELG